MTDAATGLPILYGGAKRSRSASVDSDSSDSRPSKRSRSSSEGGGDGEGGEATLASVMPPGFYSAKHDGEDGDGAASAASAASAPSAVSRPCPPAPKKAPVGASRDDEDGDGHESALRNLAERMAAAVLDSPRSPVGLPAVPPGSEPGDGAASAAGAGAGGADSWCTSVTVPDLALRLDMRHPRVLLNLFRFVSSYNELAPEGEEIHMPHMAQVDVDYILSHSSVKDPAPEFASDIAGLRSYLDKYLCHCQDEEEDDDDHDSYYSGPYRRGYDSDSE